MEFSNVITINISDVNEKFTVGGERPRSQMSKQILPQFGCLQTVTPVWIDSWLRNDAENLKWLRRDTILFSRSPIKFQGHRGRKIDDIDLN